MYQEGNREVYFMVFGPDRKTNCKKSTVTAYILVRGSEWGYFDNS